VHTTARMWALLALLGAAGCGADERSVAPSASPDRDVRQEARLPPGKGHMLARVRAPVLVHDAPGGRPIARLRRRTPFGKPRVHAIHEVRTNGRWLGIHSPVLPNRRTGWIENDGAKLALTRSAISLHVDLGKKRIDLRRGSRTVRRIEIAIGRAGTSTPPGRFQVTDKLRGGRFPAGSYGCCILALSARQPNLPQGWPGGDRIAIHGTPFDQTIGSAASNGCLRATDRELRILMRDVPAGSPVMITR